MVIMDYTSSNHLTLRTRVSGKISRETQITLYVYRGVTRALIGGEGGGGVNIHIFAFARRISFEISCFYHSIANRQ